MFYKYTNHNTGEVACIERNNDTADILAADQKYKQLTGIDPVKAPYVGCQLISDTEFALDFVFDDAVHH
jgi:hypothetical protein